MGFLNKKEKIINSKKEKKDQLVSEKKNIKRRSTSCIELSTQYLYRRAFSETQLLDVLPSEFKIGNCYINITHGDVDALSYLKVIIRQQQLDYCLLSTWCMSAEDILQIEKWIDEEKIKKIDIYVGEIFPSTYKIEYSMLRALVDSGKCSRLVVFKNHSKCFAGYGNKFPFAVWTSANVNTNPRAENAVIIIHEDAYLHAKSYYDGINSFE